MAESRNPILSGTVKIYLEALGMPGYKSSLKNVFQPHLLINLIQLKVVKSQYITATFF